MQDSIKERKCIYHMVTAIAELALTEPGISDNLKELILTTQREIEGLYLLTSHDYYNEKLNMEEMYYGYKGTDY